MIINIYEPRDKWILQNIIDAIKKYANKSIQIRSVYYKDRIVFPDGINFFCNMGIYHTYLRKNKAKSSVRDVVIATHIERWHPWNILYKRPYYFPITKIALSKMWYDWFVSQGIYPAAIAIPGVNHQFFDIQPRFVQEGKLTVALISRLYRSGRKGEQWFKPLLENIGDRFKWLVIGSRWDRILKSRSFKKFDITYNKNYSQEEYYNAFKEIDIFISLSKVEGGPIPLLESMTAGVLPIVSDTGFARDLIVHGENGFIYPIGDVMKLSNILTSLDINRENIYAFKQLAKKTAEPYTWNNFVSKIIAVMRDVDKKL